MKNSNFILAMCFALSLNTVKSQVTYTNNDNLGPPGSFVGWDNSVTTPLRISHQANQPMLFSTNNTERFRIAEFGNIGIGLTSSLSQKLHVSLDNTNASFNVSGAPFRSTAIRGTNTVGVENLDWNVAVEGRTYGNIWIEEHENVGGSFYAANAWRNLGVDAQVGGTGTTPTNVGDLGWAVLAVAKDHEFSNVGVVARATYGSVIHGGTEIIGISAGIDGAIGNLNEWAGIFQGDVQVWGDVNANGYNINPSDIQFKTNIETIENALDVINQLSPKKYSFLTEEFSHLNFPEGEQYGVIAQEIMEVLPSLVKESRMATARDTLGNIVAEPIDYLGVNYNGLIPILVAGMKEQQVIIDAQNELLAQIMERLDAVEQCCNYDGNRSINSGVENLPDKVSKEKSTEVGNALNQNIPNPFRESTTISYQLEAGGWVQLAIYDGNGKVVTTLVEANQTNGRHSAVWNANGMPAGVYHYALYVNGELLVKRAIKLQE